MESSDGVIPLETGMLLGANALIYSEDNTVYTFVRNGKKVFKIISNNIDEVLAEYKIVKGFVCNG